MIAFWTVAVLILTFQQDYLGVHKSLRFKRLQCFDETVEIDG